MIVNIVTGLATAIITGLSVYLVARVGRKTAKESQGVTALSESVHGFKALLEETRKTHDQQIAALRSQMAQQRTDLDAIANEKNKLADRMGRMERALDAARRYVGTLLRLLQDNSITAPEPPDDYMHHEET